MAKYCTKCGKEINEDAIICIHCGCSINNTQTNKEPDSDNIGWGFLGFFVPIVGFILWLIWKDEAPKKSKNLGIGALVALCIAVLGGIGYGLFVAITFGLAMSQTGMAVSAATSVFESVRTLISSISLL